MTSTDSFYDQPDWTAVITIYFYGDGETFPPHFSVDVSPEDTVAGVKDRIFNKSEDKGYNMAGIDQQSMIVCFPDDGDDKLCHYYLDKTKVRDFTPNVPMVAFLPCFL